MYFHTNKTMTLSDLEHAVGRARVEGRSLRIDVDSYGRLRFKVGEGMWSAPIDSTPDTYRDQSGVTL